MIIIVEKCGTNNVVAVEEILGLDFKTFSQLVYQSTNASLQFLTTTDKITVNFEKLHVFPFKQDC